MTAAANVSQMEPKKKPKKSAVEVQATEAEDGFVIIEQCGCELKFPVGKKIPLKAFLAFGEGDNIEGTKLLLGAEQWNTFLEKDPTIEDFEAIGQKLQESSGN